VYYLVLPEHIDPQSALYYIQPKETDSRQLHPLFPHSVLRLLIRHIRHKHSLENPGLQSPDMRQYVTRAHASIIIRISDRVPQSKQEVHYYNRSYNTHHIASLRFVLFMPVQQNKPSHCPENPENCS